jgi:tetratricopeptide (TPR) repeat protein
MDYYRGGRFELAMRQFGALVKKDRNDYESVLGYANALREVGNDRYTQATALAEARRLEGAQEKAREGHEYHTQALGWFEWAIQLRPGDPRPYYGRGLLYYHRASGAFRLFAQDEQAEIRKCAEGAVRSFDAALERQAATPLVHRYLGLMKVVLGQYRDAVPHLERYLEAVRERKRAFEEWRAPTDVQEQVREEIRNMGDEIADLEAVIEGCRKAAAEGQGGTTPAVYELMRADVEGRSAQVPAVDRNRK